MRSGVFWGYVGLIEGIVGRIRREFGAPMKVLATGGLAPLFSEGTQVFDHTDPELTINGLRFLFERNPEPPLDPEQDATEEG
jgi:type III pantothenate kinase